MKYLVNRETKEHRLDSCPTLAGLPEQWRIVEADADGWIPWNGVECPLPDWCECEIQTKEGDRLLSREAKRWTWSPNIGDATITHYRPILAEKEEISVVKKSLASESVFDRLNHAVVAAQSIPAILAEINSLLPDWYHVAKRIEPTRE